ncbi:MAG TPA: glycosyltransferase, partial [Chloroflexota bacterium]|nr:glycosyltransferase [Chloroflexota bacterium]
MTRHLVVFGLSLSSSWGNGHAPTFRGLLRALAACGWQITFFERDVEWYASNRDLPEPDFCELRLYSDWPSAIASAAGAVSTADAVLVGSLVADGPAIIDWLARRHHQPLLFYDIDTPVTLVDLQRHGTTAYLRADQVPLFDVYFSFAGGPALAELESTWAARRAEALYCGVDSLVYRPVPSDARFACALNYMGTYTADRQPAVEQLLLAPARARPADRFILAGPQYPPMDLPPNVTHQMHVYPRDHAALYCSSTATLNLTRQAMRDYGWAPSTRLFEAAACGACIISDTWPGLDRLFVPEAEILLAESSAEVVRHLDTLSPERRQALGAAARARVLIDHTYERRAQQFEAAFEQAHVAGA